MFLSAADVRRGNRSLKAFDVRTQSISIIYSPSRRPDIFIMILILCMISS